MIVSEIVIDFLKDANGVEWVSGIKGFKLIDKIVKISPDPLMRMRKRLRQALALKDPKLKRHIFEIEQ
jgi:hypothetical protein